MKKITESQLRQIISEELLLESQAELMDMINSDELVAKVWKELQGHTRKNGIRHRKAVNIVNFINALEKHAPELLAQEFEPGSSGQVIYKPRE